MSNEIEVGCMAIITNGLSRGMIVTVGEKLGVIGGMDNTEVNWEVDQPIEITNCNGSKIVYRMREDYLKRLPDDEEQPSWEAIESMTNWNPTKVTA